MTKHILACERRTPTQPIRQPASRSPITTLDLFCYHTFRPHGAIMITGTACSVLRRTAIAAAARASASQAPASLAIASTSIASSSSILPAFAFGGSIQTRNSTKRGGGSTKNNRNSPGKRLGYKKQTGMYTPSIAAVQSIYLVS